MKQKPRSRRKRSCTKSVLRMPDLEPAKAGVLNSLTCPDAQRGYRHAIACARLCHASEASWSRSNSFWGTSRFTPPNGTLAASSGFDQQSMIALASSRCLELAAAVLEGWPTTLRCERLVGFL